MACSLLIARPALRGAQEETVMRTSCLCVVTFIAIGALAGCGGADDSTDQFPDGQGTAGGSGGQGGGASGSAGASAGSGGASGKGGSGGASGKGGSAGSAAGSAGASGKSGAAGAGASAGAGGKAGGSGAGGGTAGTTQGGASGASAGGSMAAGSGGASAGNGGAGGDAQGGAAGDTQAGAGGDVQGGAAGDTQGGAGGDPQGGAGGDVQGGAGGDVQGGAAGDTQAGAGGDVQGGAAGDPQGGAAGDPQGGAAGDPQGGAAGDPQGGAAGDPQGGAGGSAGQGGSAGASAGSSGVGGAGGTGGTAGTGGSGGTGSVTCDPVGTTYHVDPVNGDDAMATGSGMAGGGVTPSCAFKTVTAAFKAINASGTPALEVLIHGPSALAASETYPLVVPKGVRVNTAGGLVTVQKFSGTAFVLKAPGAGIDAEAGLTIDGTPSGNTGTSGVAAQNGCDVTCYLRRATIQNTAGDGVMVSGVLSVGAGLTVTGAKSSPNGTTGFGLRVGDKGKAFIKATLAEGNIVFSGNALGGILIGANASLDLTGEIDKATQAGSVWADANTGPGLTVRGGATLGLAFTSDVDGLLTTGSKSGSGIRIEAGSATRVRNSVSLGNQFHGVHVLGNDNSNNVSMIDLGTKASLGKNIVGLGVLAIKNNGHAGIALTIPPPAGPVAPQTLKAAGNTFAVAKDCATVPALLSRDASATCAGSADVCLQSTPNGSHVIDVTGCSYP
jgi:hypothetical protein